MDDEWMDDAWLRGHCHVHSILGPTGRAERPRPLVRVRSNVRNRREDQRDPMQASAGPLPVPSLHLQLISSCSRCRFCASYVLIISRCARCTAACSILLRSLCPQGPAGHCLLSFTNIKELFAEDATSSIRHARCQANNRIGASSPETGTRTLLLASVIGLASTRPSS